MPAFFNYPPVHNVSADAGPLGDALNHCVKYGYYRTPGAAITSVHECSHGIAAQLCNGRTYGLYLLKDQALRLQDPIGKKADCAKFIPKEMRYGRFGTYVTGQPSQANSPLYIFDEWVAYRNGAVCLLHLDGKEGLNTDFLFGPVEFAAYGLATAMANPREDIKDFAIWMLGDVIDLYHRGRAKFGWADANKCYSQLRGNAAFRSFLGDFRFPEEADAAISYVP